MGENFKVQIDYKLFFENASDLFLFVDFQGIILRANNMWEKTFGFSREEIEGKEFILFVHPDDYASTLEKFEELLNNDIDEGFINRYRTKAGSYRTLRWKVKIVDKTIYASARDITIQVEAEEKLEFEQKQIIASFDRNRILLDAIPDMLFRINSDGIILDFKAPDKNKLYVQPEAFLNKNIKDVLPENISKQFFEKMNEAFLKNQIQFFEYDIMIGKEHLHYEARLSPNIDENEIITMIREITLQKQTLATLSMLSTAIKQATDTIFITDLEGNIIYVNPSLENIYGYKSNELIGQNPRIFKSGIKDAEFYKVLWNTIKRGENFRAEVINKRKDKTYIYEDRTITPVKNEKGEITNFLSVGRDITEKKTTDVKLAKGERKLAKVIQSSIDGFLIVNQQGKILEVNEAYCKMTGYSRNELLKMSLKDVEAKKSAEDILVHIDKILENGTDQFESVQIKKDGSKLPIEANVILGEDGTLISFVKDLTNKKKLEHELLIKEWAIDSSAIGLFITDLDATIIYVNSSILEMIGCKTKEELINKSAKEFLVDNDLFGSIIQSLLSDKNWRGYIEIRMCNNEKLIVDFTGSLVKDEIGNPVAFLGTLDYLKNY